MSNEKLGTLHVYPHTWWHSPIELLGDRNGLEMLRDAINEALEKGEGTAHHLFPNDGEGYSAHVRLYDYPFGSPEWDVVAAPYVDEIAGEKDSRALRPVGKDQWIQLVESERTFRTRMDDYRELSDAYYKASQTIAKATGNYEEPFISAVVLIGKLKDALEQFRGVAQGLARGQLDGMPVLGTTWAIDLLNEVLMEGKTNVQATSQPVLPQQEAGSDAPGGGPVDAPADVDQPPVE